LEPTHVRFEANMCVINDTALRSPLPALTVGIINYVGTLKAFASPNRGEVRGVGAAVLSRAPVGRFRSQRKGVVLFVPCILPQTWPSILPPPAIPLPRLCACGSVLPYIYHHQFRHPHCRWLECLQSITRLCCLGMHPPCCCQRLWLLLPPPWLVIAFCLHQLCFVDISSVLLTSAAFT
jgi:hypothetical protein